MGANDHLSEPPIPADADLRDFAFMPIDIVRLFGSSFHARATDSEWRAGVTLWLKSFHQVPAGSLPVDDIELCRLAELGRDLKSWKKLKAMALHNWTACTDGRLYHPVVSEKAKEAWDAKQKQRARSRAGNEARWGKRDHPDDEPPRRPEPRGPREGGQGDLNSNASAIPEGLQEGNPEGSLGHSNKQSFSDPKGQGQRKGQEEEASLRSASARRGKREVDQLEAQCREAAGLVDEAAPGLLDLSPILTLLDRGWTLETDILPVLKAAAGRGKRGRTWGYYVAAIEENRQRNGQIGAKAVPALSLDQGFRNKVAAFQRSGFWMDDWDGKPGDADCRVPAHILAEFGYQQPEKVTV